MDARILTPKDLFQKGVRYVIPAFQRPYVWNQEDQWEPLWNDVRNVAEEYLDQLSALGPEKQALAEKQAGSHFLGAVVVQQQATPTADLDIRHVIDGQQRLTTIQLLLDAAQEVFEQDGFSREARSLRKLVANDEDLAEEDPNHLFKVWPTLVDQEPFRQAMTNELAIEGFEDAPIVQAHEFFKLQIRTWLGKASPAAPERAHGLATALMGLLRTVVIDLEPDDEPNVIFETLNARGTPLLDSDLIKNAVLYKADQAGLDSRTLYERYWRDFDERWWREDMKQGRLYRPRIDAYLNYWLTMRSPEDVKAAKFFPDFLKYAESSPDITTIVADIKGISSAFRRVNTTPGYSPEGIFLYRWGVMDAGVTTPILLWLFSQEVEIGEQRLQRALAALESFLMRRTICRMTTKNYNELFLELLRQMSANGPASVDDLIVTFLSSQTADARLWPGDGQVAQAFLTLPLYQLLTRGRLRLVLEGIEDALRSPKTEEEHVRRGLTIEHIMPQGWPEHWPLSPSGQLTQLEAAQERDRIIHTIGNLTLLNEKLNPSVSNYPWRTKRAEIDKHSVLHLNKRLLEGAPDVWDENAIRERGSQLAAIMATVWPRPA